MRGNIADRIIPNVISRHVRAIENVARSPGFRLKNEVAEREEERKRERKKKKNVLLDFHQRGLLRLSDVRE